MLRILTILATLALLFGYTEGDYRVVDLENLENVDIKLLAPLHSRERRQAPQPELPEPERQTSEAPPITTPLPTTTTTVRVEEDIQKYYKTRYLVDEEAVENWVDLDNMEKGIKKTHGTLSKSHKTAAPISLSFKFIFYGHEVAKVTIATGGFLYMSEFLHQWLTATQYIAPLMANFDLSIGNHSDIHYVDNTTHFAVQWDNVLLQDDETVGPFTFQVILKNNGQIMFGYKRIPVNLDAIKETSHPVKVGLSDAYYIDTQTSGSNVKRRTIYEYHRVAINKGRVLADTAIIMDPIPTCIQQKDCMTCVTANLDFDCRWCDAAQRCSDGLDRYRQDWLKKNCHTQDTKQAAQCQTVHPAVIAVVCILVIALIGGVVAWVVYAYTHPNTSSGRWLIDHRPSELKRKMQDLKVSWFKRGDSASERYAVGHSTESTA